MSRTIVWVCYHWVDFESVVVDLVTDDYKQAITYKEQGERYETQSFELNGLLEEGVHL